MHLYTYDRTLDGWQLSGVQVSKSLKLKLQFGRPDLMKIFLHACLKEITAHTNEQKLFCLIFENVSIFSTCFN